jgi:hypothetical protein
VPTKPNVNERVAVLETKMDSMHEDLTVLRRENREDHAVVMNKLDTLMDLKNYILGACALAGIILTWVATQVDWHTVIAHAVK